MTEEIKKLAKSQVEFQLTIPAAELEKYSDAAAQELSEGLKIAGFRPGKAPRKIVEQKVGSEKILAHAAEKAIKKSYVDFITARKIEVIGEPQITITKIAPGNDLECKVVTSVMPKIELGNYRKVAKGIKKTGAEEMKPEEMQKELDYLAKSRAKLITVRRAAKKDDRVEIDFEVSIDGKVIEGGKSQNHPLTIGESYFIPGFEEKLAGMKENEVKEFELKFPEDYHQKELAGKLAAFKVTMKLVQEKQLPEVTDEFAKSLGNFEGLEALKKSIREGFSVEQKKKNEEKWRQDVLDKIVQEAEIDVPDILIENELARMMSEFEHNISMMGMKMDDYLVNIKKTRDELKKDWNDGARKRVVAAIALKEISELENISPESAEIEEEMNKTLAHFKSHGELDKNLDMGELYNHIRGVLANEKVFKFLENL